MQKAKRGRKNREHHTFFTSSKNAVMALLLVAAAISVYSLVNAAVVSHTPEEIQPQGAGSGLDSDFLQGVSAAELRAATGGAAASGQMALQGIISYGDSWYRTAVPVVLPKAGCQVIITACGVSSAGEANSITFNADPTRATLRAANQVPRDSIPMVYLYNSFPSRVPAGATITHQYYDSEDGDYEIYYCPAGSIFISSFGCYLLCPADFPQTAIEGRSVYCHATPRCDPAASVTENLMNYDVRQGQCVYCPSGMDYDSITATCSSDSGVSGSAPIISGSVTCTTFKTTLDIAITDITFKKDASFAQIRSVEVAYSCPNE